MMAYIRHKKITIDGHTFDSQTEASYYLHLKDQNDIESIELQPKFVLLEPFHIICKTCKGKGLVPSPKTGKLIKCKKCMYGTNKRQGWTYTADFSVTYKDGRNEVIDVKGHANERFPLVKKMFEYTTSRELIVIKKVKGKWVKS